MPASPGNQTLKDLVDIMPWDFLDFSERDAASDPTAGSHHYHPIPPNQLEGIPIDRGDQIYLQIESDVSIGKVRITIAGGS